jgi:hypothetical protein
MVFFAPWPEGRILISALFSLLLRVVLTVASVLLVLWLLAMALAVAIGITVWRLLRGQRPGFAAFSTVRQRAQQGPWARSGAARRPSASADVVDIEAREIPEARPPLR